MKKKKLLGILAVLMVFALALTGCGQQSGEQNAGATGSESQNEAIDNGNSSADEILQTSRPRKMLTVTISIRLPLTAFRPKLRLA